jgi:murein DD-endopeptidase
VPYRYGGETPSGFDCSGLVQYVYRSAGLSVPRNSREQRRSARPVSLAQAEAGDLVFFQSRNWSHVGIYLGENRFVHAPSTGKTVTIASFDEAWYQRNFIGAGRLPAAGLLAGDCDRHC